MGANTPIYRERWPYEEASDESVRDVISSYVKEGGEEDQHPKSHSFVRIDFKLTELRDRLLSKSVCLSILIR